MSLFIGRKKAFVANRAKYKILNTNKYLIINVLRKRNIAQRVTLLLLIFFRSATQNGSFCNLN